MTDGRVGPSLSRDERVRIPPAPGWDRERGRVLCTRRGWLVVVSGSGVGVFPLGVGEAWWCAVVLRRGLVGAGRAVSARGLWWCAPRSSTNVGPGPTLQDQPRTTTSVVPRLRNRAPTRRQRCPSCHHAANAKRLRDHQATEANRRRSTGDHPSNRPEVRKRIADSQRAQWAERRHVGSGGGFTGRPSEFRRLILPRLAGLRSRDLARETGPSPGHCAQVRDGKRVPHVRHWAVLQLAGLRAPEPGQGGIR